MELLKKRILKEGRVLPGDVLKIDSFLNHQIDVELVDEIGKEFHRLFDEKVDKILTIESSGIAVAVATSKYYGNVPVVFAKKVSASNMANDVYSCKEHSYTRNIEYNIQVAKEYLNKGERILLIDDFLAKGEAFNSLIDICKQAECEIVGCGTVVCKTYQEGLKRIKDMGIHVEVLAPVKSLENNTIIFD